MTALPAAVHKGRGAIGNAAGRFEAYQTVAVDDGWAAAGHDSPPPRTTRGGDASRGLIARNAAPDVPFVRAVNPDRG
ncbi:MAG: radical SAM protein, partial [Pseudomonadota bacterium]|nr:radical SAM protein [Pseudomonadota bacterium]